MHIMYSRQKIVSMEFNIRIQEITRNYCPTRRLTGKNCLALTDMQEIILQLKKTQYHLLIKNL